MKKIFTLVVLFAAFTFTANAQLSDGSTAPDWTLTDLNGDEHHLYEYLDNGYSVVLDFSAVWCGPCWGYHTSGALEDLYENHGPAGMAGVSEETTDDVMVFMIEGDNGSIDNLNGIGTGTQGNWVEGTLYPIIADPSITAPYQIGYWPTIYTVCQDRTVTESGQVGTSAHYAVASACGFAQFATDARLTSLDSPLSFCGDEYVAEITIQNLSTETVLTTATITVAQDGTELLSYDWTGSLETYATDQVTLPAISGFNSTDPLDFNISIIEDMDDSNNSVSGVIQSPYAAAYITVEVYTDNYGSETTWDVRDGSNAIVASGGPYTDGTNELFSELVSLTNVECYEFNIYDAYGDGICCAWGDGYFNVLDENGVAIISGGEFIDFDSRTFKNEMAAVSVEEISAIANVNVYPNPVNETANVVFNLTSNVDTNIEIVNILGEVVYTENLGTLTNGQHTTVVDVQGLTNGIYFLNIISEGNIVSKKINVSK